MPRHDRPWRAVLLAVTAGLGALALAVPGTSGAFTARLTNTTDSAASKSVFTCADLFASTTQRSRAYFEYTLSESVGATRATDSSATGNTGTYVGANSKDGTTPTACPADAGGPYALDGTSSGVTTTTKTTFGTAVAAFTLSVWFRTSAATGKLIGFESAQGSTSDTGQWDRMLYVGTSGRIFYGLYPGQLQTINTPAAVNDDVWHQVVATTSSAGSTLYLDGVAVANDAGMTIGQAYAGWWHVGAGRYSYWPEESGTADTGHFGGSLRFAAALKYAMTAAAVRSSYRIGAPA